MLRDNGNFLILNKLETLLFCFERHQNILRIFHLSGSARNDCWPPKRNVLEKKKQYLLYFEKRKSIAKEVQVSFKILGKKKALDNLKMKKDFDELNYFKRVENATKRS